MPRPDEREHRHPRDAAHDSETTVANEAADSLPPSKTRRKAEMHALQDLGEALIALDPKRLAEGSEGRTWRLDVGTVTVP